MLLLGIGGSYVKYALADMDGRLKEETVGQTPAHADGSFEEICGVLLSVLESARRRQEVSRVCISIPGLSFVSSRKMLIRGIFFVSAKCISFRQLSERI